MFVETGKKFIESFPEIKNQKSVVFNLLYRNVADDVLFQDHFTDLDYLGLSSSFYRLGLS